MNVNDMILVSVDDHVVEPPDLFDDHLPAKWKDRAPVLRHNATTAPTSGCSRATSCPNIGLNAVVGRPPEEYGIEPTALRRDAPGLLRHPRARPRHERQRRARLDVLPVASRSSAASCSPGPSDKDLALGAAAGLQRLAHRRVVRRAPGPVHPAVAPADLGSRADGRRGAARRGQGLPRRHVLREPGRSSATRASTATTGIRSGRPASTRAPWCASTSARRRQLVVTVDRRADRRA